MNSNQIACPHCGQVGPKASPVCVSCKRPVQGAIAPPGSIAPAIPPKLKSPWWLWAAIGLPVLCVGTLLSHNRDADDSTEKPRDIGRRFGHDEALLWLKSLDGTYATSTLSPNRFDTTLGEGEVVILKDGYVRLGSMCVTVEPKTFNGDAESLPVSYYDWEEFPMISQGRGLYTGKTGGYYKPEFRLTIEGPGLIGLNIKSQYGFLGPTKLYKTNKAPSNFLQLEVVAADWMNAMDASGLPWPDTN